MRGSFVLGILGGIFGILIGFGVLLFAGLTESFEEVGFLEPSGEVQQLYTQAGVAIFGGILGIAGGAIGRKIGGALLIVGSIMTLLGAGAFGVLPFVLLIIGGVLALREKPTRNEPS